MTTPTLPGSTGYGVDIYGTVLYGYSQPKSLSVEPFLATQPDYGRISLSWASPNDTAWRKLRLVRSTDGYPSTPSDGTVLLDARVDSIRTQYDDANLTQGVIYYYSIFMSQDAAAWDSGTTYIQSAVVFHNDTYWFSLQADNTNHTPAIGSVWWAPTTYFPTWYPAGSVAALTVKDQGYPVRLYDRSPQPYKITRSDLFANTTVDNPAFARFLSLFGYQFDALKTSYDQLLHLNDVDLVSADNLEYLGAQFGIQTDYISSPRLRRNRVKNASVNYRLKGTWNGIHNAIAAVTGWDSELEVGPNMMLNSDQSAFVHPSYETWNADTNYFVNQFVSYNGFNYKNIVAAKGAAQAPTGTNSSNTWWQVQVNSVDSTTLLNPSTKGFSTWGRYLNSGLTVSLSTIVGVPHPTIAATNTWNALYHAVTTGAPVSGFTGVNSIATLSTPTWSNGTNYVTNNYVSHNTFFYKALRASGPATSIGAVTPGTNDLYWELQASNVGVGRGQFVRDGIPLPRQNTWDSVLPFKVGDTVQHNGILYICLEDNAGQSPTGRYASNTYWQYISPAEQAFTASHYTSRFTSATNVQSASRILWYDDDGNTLFTASPPTNATMFARFDTDYVNLDGNTDNTTSLAWAVTPTGATYWESTFGQARVNPDAFNALGSKPKYTYLLVNDGRANGVIGYTFGVDYEDTTNFDNGVVFRSTSGTNKWFCTRTRLVLLLGGIESTLASWTRLGDYERITITLNGSSIIVRKYNRDGTGATTTLASITNANLQTETRHGLIQRYALGT